VVESNKDEERLARIETMLQALQREAAALKATTARLIDVMQVTRTLTTLNTSGTSAVARSSERRWSSTVKATLRATARSSAKRRA
jgi:hypothetical protein